MTTLNQAVSESLEQFERARQGNDPTMSKNTANLYSRALKSVSKGIALLGSKPLEDITFDDVSSVIGQAPSENKAKEVKKALTKVFSCHGVNFPKLKRNITLCNITLASACDSTSAYILNLEKENVIKAATANAYQLQLSKLTSSEFFGERRGVSLSEIQKNEFEKYMYLHAHGASAHNQTLSMFRMMEKANV